MVNQEFGYRKQFDKNTKTQMKISNGLEFESIKVHSQQNEPNYW